MPVSIVRFRTNIPHGPVPKRAVAPTGAEVEALIGLR